MLVGGGDLGEERLLALLEQQRQFVERLRGGDLSLVVVGRQRLGHLLGQPDGARHVRDLRFGALQQRVECFLVLEYGVGERDGDVRRVLAAGARLAHRRLAVAAVVLQAQAVVTGAHERRHFVQRAAVADGSRLQRHDVVLSLGDVTVHRTAASSSGGVIAVHDVISLRVCSRARLAHVFLALRALGRGDDVAAVIARLVLPERRHQVDDEVIVL